MRGEAMMKLLFISNLFPDIQESYRGLDNVTLLHHLREHCEVRVICARPAIWGSSRWRQAYTPRSQDECFQPVYVRVPYLPKIGDGINHRLFGRALNPAFMALRESFAFDSVLCAWAYPDACGVLGLTQKANVPLTVITQGTDVHTYLDMPVRRRLISSALGQTKAVINRSRNLAQRLAAAGVPEAKLKVIYNGVDTDTFSPADKQAARRSLGLPLGDKLVLFVGNFLPVKNPGLLLEAFAEVRQRQVPNARLLLIGGGPLEGFIRAEVVRLGMADQVQIVGRKSAADVARYMQAADVLALSSHHEGLPNVILEALAAGLPAVATQVGGIHEILNADYLGRLCEPGNRDRFAAALGEVLQRENETARISQYGKTFNWPQAAREYWQVISG
jgi:teichuronic acid biosynthesis glycosyltransferase TuaC